MIKLVVAHTHSSFAAKILSLAAKYGPVDQPWTSKELQQFISDGRYDKVPKLECVDGSTMPQEVLQNLLFAQWRNGGEEVSTVAYSALTQLNSESRDLLARTSWGWTCLTT